MGLRILTEPDTDPITLELAKGHLRVTTDDEDSLVKTYIAAATKWAEEYMRRAVVEQTWTLTGDLFPIRAPFTIGLPLGRCTAVNQIDYTDSAGAAQVLRGPSSSSPVGTDYQEDLSGDEGGRIRPNSDEDWPQTEDHIMAAVSIEFVVGYGAGGARTIPASVITGILYRLTDLYEFRGAIDGNGTANAKDQLSAYRLQKW